METIINTFVEDSITLGLMLGVLAVCWLANTIAGSVNAIIDNSWDRKKFKDGLLKGVLMAISTILLFIVVELIPLIVERISDGLMDINTEFVASLLTKAEVFGMTFVALKNYALDCFSKLKELFGEQEEDLDKVIDMHHAVDVESDSEQEDFQG